MLHARCWLLGMKGQISSGDNLRGFEQMKKIETIIVPGKLDTVRAELERSGMQATLTLTDVQQAEEQKASILPDAETLRPLTDRLKVELIVGDRQAQKAVEVLTQYGQVALLRVNETLQLVPPLSDT
jgi:nitrogen regulatory protein PII